METPARRPRFVVAAEWTFLVVVLSVLATLAARVSTDLRAAHELLDVLCVLAAIPLGIAVADLFSGIVHWGCDTFLREDAPLIGPLFIAPFREHHRDPLAMTRHGFVERNAVVAFASLPAIGLGLLPSASVLGSMTALACATAVLFTNELHSWAHAPEAPPAVRWLQRRGLILSPERHAAHHRAGVSGYSVTTGWTSAFLDRVLALLRAPRGAA
jgi:hypothetical protein